MVVHTKMSIYNTSINQRSKSDIYHQNNQTTFLNIENSFGLVLGSLSLKKFINVEFKVRNTSCLRVEKVRVIRVEQ
jgi:hypothetical protein